MFARQRKARVLFGLSDVLLTTLGYEAAYRTRTLLRFENEFFLSGTQQVLLLGSALVAWVVIGLWLDVYEKLDTAHPRIILRDTFRQCVYGAIWLVVFEYVLRLELSRPFLLLFSTYTWVLLLLFRLTAGRVVGVVRRGFVAPHQVLIAGTGSGRCGWRRRWRARRSSTFGCAASSARSAIRRGRSRWDRSIASGR